MKYILEIWTAISPDNAGTGDPIYVSISGKKADGGAFNIAQSRNGNLGLGDHDAFSFPVSGGVSETNSAVIRLKGLAPNPVDNWLPKRIKLMLDREDGSDPQVIVDHNSWPSDQWFDDNNRSWTILGGADSQEESEAQRRR